MALQQDGDLNVPGVGVVGVPVLEPAAEEAPTKVLCLPDLITADELMDDEDYRDILEEEREEGRRFGGLVNVVIPRPDPNGDPVRGLGRVFLEYADASNCANAKNSLGGRKFAGKVVTSIYYPEDKFFEGDYGA